MTTASTTSAKDKKSAQDNNWHIQIGASENKSKLMEVLQTARSKNKKLLSGNKPVTIKVAKGNRKLYRARFTGFASYESAARACKALKKQKYACLALNG